jgi:hopene-associated glycosyltransferase HpnB
MGEVCPVGRRVRGQTEAWPPSRRSLSTRAAAAVNSWAMLADPLTWLSLASAVAWGYLLIGHGGFWRARERLDGAPPEAGRWPAVAALVPARNEAEVIGTTVGRLLSQDYPGPFRVIVIDDHSDDGTAAAARRAAEAAVTRHAFTVIGARPLEPGWAGKVWALSEGLAHAVAAHPDTHYVWLTDADIAHDPANLRRLAGKAEAGGLDMVSQMVRLVSEGFWASLLIPAFVFFFQKLYPFARVNDPARRTAAAAGGSVLLRRDALERIGGFGAIRDAIIDDCALARAVKTGGRPAGGRIWLGLTTAAESLRPYQGLAGVWRMVSRSAFTQLGYSAALLALTLAGMMLLYWGPPVVAAVAALSGAVLPLGLSLLAWVLMTLAFLPTLRLYRKPLIYAPALPLAGLLYSLMTLASAVAFWCGRGGAWKGRTLAGIEKNARKTA